MPGMTIYLDQFEENDHLERRFELEPGEASRLLSDSGYEFESELVAEVTANRLESTIRVTGELSGTVGFDCGRCLEHRTTSFEVEADFVLMRRELFEATYEGDEIELDADDLDVSTYSGDEIDLAPLVREAILLELPPYPRCSDEHRELCDAAYDRNIGDEAKEKLEEAAMDQRWAALKDVKLKD